jgi:hypothetical protein
VGRGQLGKIPGTKGAMSEGCCGQGIPVIMGVWARYKEHQDQGLPWARVAKGQIWQGPGLPGTGVARSNACQENGCWDKGCRGKHYWGQGLSGRALDNK